MLQLEVHDSDSDELRQVARQAVGRVSERAHFVLLSAQGYSPPAIGGLLGYDVQTVRTWLRAYQQQGCAGLADAPRSGRPLKDRYLTAVVQAQASQPPPNSGYIQACWTVALLVLHLATRFRLTISASRVRRALQQAGFCWKRPKLVPARRRDPRTSEKEAQIAAALADPTATLLAEDEADQQLLPVLRAMWQRVGQQVGIPTPGQNAKRGIFGALNVRSGAWFYQLTAHKRSADFIVFLTRVLVAYPPAGCMCWSTMPAFTPAGRCSAGWRCKADWCWFTCRLTVVIGSIRSRKSGGRSKAPLPLIACSATWPNSTPRSVHTLPTSRRRAHWPWPTARSSARLWRPCHKQRKNFYHLT
jgi:transposase